MNHLAKWLGLSINGPARPKRDRLDVWKTVALGMLQPFNPSTLQRSTILALLLTASISSAQSTGPPVIQAQPQSQTVFAGATVSFTVAASGAQPLSYQWYKSAGATFSPIPNATSTTLKLSAVDLPDAGIYFVKVTNLFGMDRSADVQLGVTRVDFGDAPASYQTLWRDDGAYHLIAPGVYLGAGVSFEPDGQPDPNASLDTFDDGVTFLSALVPGNICTLQVVASVDGFLYGWLDFNANGTWLDEGEQIFAGVKLLAGTNTLSFFVPATVQPTTANTFARFRFTTVAGIQLRPSGPAPDGEVEDYAVRIFPVAADLTGAAMISPDPVPPTSTGQCVLTVNNLGPSPASNVTLSNTLSGTDVLNVQPPNAAITCTIKGDTVVCLLGNMQPGEVQTVRFDFHPQQPSLITNTLTVRSDTFDPKPANNRSTIVVRAADPLVITQQPQTVKVLPGANATFSVVAQGVSPLSYQWLLNGAAIAGATDSTLTLFKVRQSAEIRVRVSDSFGSVLSAPAGLCVLLPPVILEPPQPIRHVGVARSDTDEFFEP